MKLPSQKCEIFIDGQHSCAAELSEALTSNVAEVLYKNEHKILFSHLFLIVGATRRTARHPCQWPFAKRRYGNVGRFMNIHIKIYSV